MPPTNKPRSIKPAREGPANAKEQISKKKAPSGRISAACEACKKRKTKCSGHPPPCQMCMQLNTPCIIDLTLDMRRRTALQRTIDESRGFQETLDDLVEVLRGGDGIEIQVLVQQIQKLDHTTNAAEFLQAKFRSLRDSTDTSMKSSIKEEADSVDGMDGEVSSMSKDEEAEVEGLNTTFMGSESPRKRPLSMYEGDSSRASRPFNPSIQTRNKDQERTGSLGSRYLPLLSKLRTVSDLEASRLLHTFKTSPVDIDGVATLSLFDQYQSHSTSPARTDQAPWHSNDEEQRFLGRRNWHPSLRVAAPDNQASMVNPSFQSPFAGRELDPSLSQSPHGVNSGQSFQNPLASGTNNSSISSDLSSVVHSDVEVAQEVHAHSTPYEAARTLENAQVIEIYGDLRSLDGASAQPYHTSPDEFPFQFSTTIPRYQIQPRLVLEDSPLSRVYTGFRDAARQMIANGTPAVDVINGSDVVVDLFLRERRPTDGFTCATWACELCRSFGEVDDLVRLGCIFLLTRLMRWMIFPTPQTYNEVPECQRPTATQCFVPHVPAVDLHPMPAFRDMLCNQLQDWITPLESTRISCNWPYRIEDALEADPISGSTKVSQLFMDHVSSHENWSLNVSALTYFPDIAGEQAESIPPKFPSRLSGSALDALNAKTAKQN